MHIVLRDAQCLDRARRHARDDVDAYAALHDQLVEHTDLERALGAAAAEDKSQSARHAVL
jgi:hypothetical protein